ncbi:hypothetical protein DV735_g4965, partial [Chaetothyriales sp. CBS 134920]
MADYSVWSSSPSVDGIGAGEWGVIAAAGVFLCLACYHGSLSAARRAWCLWGLTAASLLECLSLLNFAYSLERPGHTAQLIFGAFFRWGGPYILSLSLVQIFGRVAWYGSIWDARRISYYWGFLRWNTSIFVVLHTIVFIVEMVGSIVVAVAATANDTPTASAGMTVINTGLILQLLVILAFSTIAFRFRTVSREWYDGPINGNNMKRRSWKTLLTAILACCLLTMLAQAIKIALCVARTPPNWTIYVCNGVALFVVFVALAVIHPCNYLPASLTCLRFDKSLLLDASQSTVTKDTKGLPSLSSSSGSSEGSSC